MNAASLRQLLNSKEPMAIIRYFEWASFSRSYNHPCYSLLIINSRNIDLEEINIPDQLTSVLVSQLPKFQKVVHTEGGSVWERHNFREQVKRRVPQGKIRQFIRYY